MALEAAMASRVPTTPPNIVAQTRQPGLCFIPSKPLAAAPPSQICLISKFRSLTIQSDPLPTARWSFVNSEVHSASKAEIRKLTSRAAMALRSDTKEGKNAKQSAKHNRPKLSTRERNPKRLSSSASEREVLDYFQTFKYPLISDLAMREMIKNNTLTFVVDKHADKDNIKAAAKKMFKIQTRKVNTLMTPDGSKKAYLMLKPNHNALEIAKKLKIL